MKKLWRLADTPNNNHKTSLGIQPILLKRFTIVIQRHRPLHKGVDGGRIRQPKLLEEPMFQSCDRYGGPNTELLLPHGQATVQKA